MKDEFPELDVKNLPEPPPEAYEEVRRRVIADIRRRKRLLTALRTIGAAAACLLLIWGASVLVRPSGPEPGPPPILAQAPAPPSMALDPAITPVHRVPRRRLQRRPVTPLLAQAEPLIVKMQTDDPNVVIIWMVD